MYKINKSAQSHKFSVTHIFEPFIWLYNNNISYKDYFNSLKFSDTRHIGVMARYKESGYASDGSYYYTHLVTSPDAQVYDCKFSGTLGYIKEGANRFSYATKAGFAYFANFIEVLKIFKAHDIKVILFFPPMALTVIQEMKKYNYQYIDDLKNKFREVGLYVYDFTDPIELVETADCEFIDGFHGGDVLYAKILRFLSEQEPLLSNYVDKDYLDGVIHNFSGLAMIPDSTITTRLERDFLCLGCTKLKK